MAPSTTPDHDDSWNILDFVVKRGHGVKGLSEKELEKVPNQYIQPLKERLGMKNVVVISNENESIPIIDVSNIENDPKIGDAICNAAEKWGLFQIINHGVPMEVIEKVMGATRDFFALSAEEKSKYSKGKFLSDDVRYGTSFIPEAESSLEWKDYLSLLYASHEEASKLWPQECRDQALNYLKWSEPIIKKLLEVLMRRLNVKEIDKNKSSLLTGSKRINLNYYPKCPNPDLTVGVGRHSDISTLTILLQDDIGGLYVRTENNSWVHVPPVVGSIVINVGDALQIISNGRYKSIEHRVVAHGTRNRVSVPIFVNPRPRDMIGPLPELIQNGEKPVYKHVLYSDYAKHFYGKSHDGKKTIDFAII